MTVKRLRSIVGYSVTCDKCKATAWHPVKWRKYGRIQDTWFEYYERLSFTRKWFLQHKCRLCMFPPVTEEKEND